MILGSRGLLIGSPRTPICGLGLLFFLEIYPNQLYGTAAFSGIAFWDSYYEMSSEIPVIVM